MRSTHASTVVEEPQSPGLIRSLGLWDVTAITAGTILGSAIFVAAAFVPSGNLLTALGLGIVVVLGSFDGWYQATICAGETKRPERNLPLGMSGSRLSS